MRHIISLFSVAALVALALIVVGGVALAATIGCTTNPCVGTLGDDRIKGSNGDEHIFGLGGNDTIDCNRGSDIVVGDDNLDPSVVGDDKLDGGTGDDQLFGYGGSDTFIGGPGSEKTRELVGVVAQDPERFAQASSRFRDLDPTYARGLINGLRDAAKQGPPFSWSPVLDLCLWIVSQPRDIPGRLEKQRELIERQDLDPDWGWTRKAIAELLEEGFKVDGASMPPERREQAWAVLLPLTDDPEPDTEYEERYGGSNMDPVTLSLNTVRSQAMHAVIGYALWVRRHLQEDAGGEERVARGFNEMPEVRNVLEGHLDPEKDPSVAVRAVYGWWFPQLILLDQSWAIEKMAEIFSPQEPLSGLRRAAWGAYVVVQPPYEAILKILRGEY